MSDVKSRDQGRAPAEGIAAAKTALDSQVRELVDWHFDPASGCPFWLDYAKKLGWDPRKEIQGFADLTRLGSFEDEWLRGGPVGRWVPRGLAGKPVFVFETGGTTGVPKTRVACDDFRTDYELFSATLPDEHFPKGSNWLMLGPSGPRRLRLAVEHLAQFRGGICFCVDLDPRWVIKLIKKGWLEHLQAYKDHVIDQAVTILGAGHDIRCMFTTPKLLESLALRLESMGSSIRKAGITGIFSGGTEFTPQWNRFAHEELLDGAYMTPTYGNTLMGLAASTPSGPENGYKISYYPPQPRAAIEVVSFDDPNQVVAYGETGRVKLTTLTKEFFVPGFLERDEGEREPPSTAYPWDGVSGVQAVSRARRDHHGRSLLNMLHLPVLRWGQPYTSLEADEVKHFSTGEPVAKVSRANGGMLQRDMRKAGRAREVLREIPIDDLIARVARAGELYTTGTVAMGDGTQTPDEFVRAQSASTGLPEAMCRANMKKNAFVLGEMRRILESLTRGLDLKVLTSGYGEERGVPISYQAQSPVLGLVLPSNSPGVHTLWLPIIPMQIGLVLKPGPQEPWTPYRMAEAFFAAGIPREAIALYPGGADVGAAVLDSCGRSLVFGGQATVDQYRGNPRVQPHGPGFSKIVFGDDEVDDWERYIDVMVESVFINSGRGCINCSGIWASRHTREIAEAVAKRLAAIRPLPPDHPDAALAAFTIPGAAASISGSIDADLQTPGVEDVTARYRDTPRVIPHGNADYLLPTVVHCDSPDAAIAKKEYMFPFVTVVECPEAKMLDAMGPTLVCTALTGESVLRQRLLDAVHIDRLNFGPVPTSRLNWLQPHEGNIVDFLFRPRAFQAAPLAG